MADDPSARELLEALNEGVVLLDAEGRVRHLNAAAAAMLDTDPARAAGRLAIEVLRDHRLADLEPDSPPVEVGVGPRTLLVRRLGGALVFEDRSGVRAAERNMRELLAVVSHELRTPAAVISANLETLLAGGVDPARSRRFLELAHRESLRLARLVEDLTVEVAPPRYRRLEVGEVARRALGVVAQLAEERAVELVLDLPEATVVADSDKLNQALINLVENALIHGPNPGRVRVSGYHAGPLFVVRVDDEGTPLPKESFPALFEAGRRGDNAKAKGTGLGLYIVCSIARAWGGDAWGEPLTRGNRFAFSVPLG
jgi:signal transduction histidine kinase